MSGTLTWKPHPGAQERFHSCPSFELLYGGAAFGGKSESLIMEASKYIQHGDYFALLLRRKFTELSKADGLMDRAQKWYPTLGGKWSGDKRRWSFPSGAVVEFGHMEYESNKYDYRSAAYAFVGFDEVTSFTESQYLYVVARCRSANSKIPRSIRAATNPGNIGHCVPFGDVLTSNGWKRIQDIKAGEFVATRDDEGNLIFAVTEQIHNYDFNGKLFKYDANTTKIQCTPNHQIARITETKRKTGRTYHGIKLVQVKNLSKVSRLVRSANWISGQEIKEFYVPFLKTRKLKLKQPDRITGDDYCELMGWMLSEGFITDRHKVFGISQSKQENRKQIEVLLKRCNFVFHKTNKQFTIYSPKWWKYFKQFGKCRDKFIPLRIKQAPKRQIEIFFKAIMKGDGDKRGYYYTLSQKLANDMQEIGLKLGYNPLIASRLRKNRKYICYEVRFRLGRDGYLERDKFEKIQYNGKVYCLGIKKYHRFFIRQNGAIWLSGNSWVKKRFVTGKKPYTVYEDKNGNTRCFIPATAYDNPTGMKNDPDYVKRLELLPDKEKRMLLYGDWDVFEGQFFADWEDRIHICKPFNLGNAYRFIAMDYGFATPSSVGWFAVTEGGMTYLYRELYMEKLNYPGLAKMILDMTPKNEQIFYCVADPSIWGDKAHHKDAMVGESGGETMANIFDQRITLIKGDNNRITGWGRCREYLKPYKANGEVTARFKVFDTCPNFIRTVPQMIHNEKGNIEDMDTFGEDHLADMWRYGMMSRPGVPDVVKESHILTRDERLWKLAKSTLARQKKGSDMLYIGGEG